LATTSAKEGRSSRVPPPQPPAGGDTGGGLVDGRGNRHDGEEGVDVDEDDGAEDEGEDEAEASDEETPAALEGEAAGDNVTVAAVDDDEAADGTRSLGSTQRNLRALLSPAHEKTSCSWATLPCRGNGNCPLDSASSTACSDESVAASRSNDGDQPAFSKNCPSTGNGVRRLGGQGPRQEPALGRRRIGKPPHDRSASAATSLDGEIDAEMSIVSCSDPFSADELLQATTTEPLATLPELDDDWTSQNLEAGVGNPISFQKS
jgi:hypothetical protein